MKREQCASCGGILVARKVTYEKIVGIQRVLFEQVPARVCSACDEVWIDGKIAEKMERLFRKKLHPTRWLKIPVLSFSRAA